MTVTIQRAFVRFSIVYTCIASSLVLSACTVSPPSIKVMESSALEHSNRAAARFNERLPWWGKKRERSAQHPLTLAANVLANVGEIPDAANHLLQGRPRASLDDALRLTFNSTFGMAGVFDVASEMGIPDVTEDFGQTLRVWGMPSGTYIVLPFVGSTTALDLAAKPVDAVFDPLNALNVDQVRVVTVVKAMASHNDAGKVLGSPPANADRYAFQRDAWLAYRTKQAQE